MDIIEFGRSYSVLAGGFVEYREAFGPEGRYGRWLRTKLDLGEHLCIDVFQPARCSIRLDSSVKEHCVTQVSTVGLPPPPVRSGRCRRCASTLRARSASAS